MSNYLDLRKKLVKDVNHKFKTNRLGKNYSKLKALLNLEIGAILAFVFVKFKIKPNQITFLYIFLIFIGVYLFFTGQDKFVLVGCLIFFFKNSIDLIDGFIARVQKNSSEMGHILDTWAGQISLIGFQVAIGLYLYSVLENINYLYLIIINLLTYALDFKKHFLTNKLNFKKKNLDMRDHFFREKLSLKKIIIKVLLFFEYDGRSRYTDLILLLILFEMYLGYILLLNLIFIFWSIINLIKFFYKIMRIYEIYK